VVGWLSIAFGSRTLRGDGAEPLLLVDPLLATGIVVLLVSSVCVVLPTASRRATVSNG
jgi:hypothetical protein